MIAFLQFQGSIHKEFVPADKIINADYYKGIMDQLLK